MNEIFKIVFMGTPDFAVPALEAIHKSVHEVILVVTQPDRPKGRGRKLLHPPVKKAVMDMGYDIIQPESLKTGAFADMISKLQPDIIVVVAFGHILSERVLALPRLGAVNIHASLLPKYRGSAPIQWAIINGEKETGVTIMFMDKGLDTGDILLSGKIEIAPDDTSASLHDRLADLGADLLTKILDRFKAGDIHPILQDHNQATYSPILKKKDGLMDWEKPAQALETFIRGVTPWPGAFTFHEDKRLKIFKACCVSTETQEPPGTVIKSFPDELRVATGKGVLCVLEIQGASGKRLLIRDFLRGYKMPPGTVLH